MSVDEEDRHNGRSYTLYYIVKSIPEMSGENVSQAIPTSDQFGGYQVHLNFNSAGGKQFGAVTDIYVAMDKFTGRPRGFAFVTMGTPEEAKLAIEKTNGVDLGGRALQVNEARPKEEGAGRSFGGGGGGGGRGFGGGGGRGGDRRY